MLVLSRHRDERIVIRHAGEELVLTVCDLDGARTRLGFEAPRSFTIHRLEVQEAIDRERREPEGLALGSGLSALDCREVAS